MDDFAGLWKEGVCQKVYLFKFGIIAIFVNMKTMDALLNQTVNIYNYLQDRYIWQCGQR